MDYLHKCPNAVLRYQAGTIQLKVESNASYLAVRGAKSRIAGHFYLEASRGNIIYTADIAPILTECSVLKNVVCSAAETECGGLFHNSQKGVVIRVTLNGLGHKQLPTEIKTDNSTANPFVHATMRLKRAKTWDMRWNWLKEKSKEKVFKILWEKGKLNKADLFTKLYPYTNMKEKRSQYIHSGT